MNGDYHVQEKKVKRTRRTRLKSEGFSLLHKECRICQTEGVRPQTSLTSLAIWYVVHYRYATGMKYIRFSTFAWGATRNELVEVYILPMRRLRMFSRAVMRTVW